MPRKLRRDGTGVSPLIAIILLTAIAVALSAGVFLLYSTFSHDDDAMRTVSGAHGSFRGGEYRVFLGGPDDILLEGAVMRASIDGVPYEFDMEVFAPQVADGKTWKVGELLCVLGPPPCAQAPVGDAPATGREVQIQVISRQNIVFTLPPLTWVPSFVIEDDGGIRVQCSVPAVMTVLGVEITYGAGGPDIPVTMGLSTNGAPPFTPLFGGSPVAAGQVFDLHTVPAGSILGVQGHAEYSSFDEVRTSFDDDPHVYVLRNDDPAPDFAPFAGQAPLEGFLAPYVDTQTQTMVLSDNEAIILFEFVDNLQSSAADFQDLVVLFDFESDECTT